MILLHMDDSAVFIARHLHNDGLGAAHLHRQPHSVAEWKDKLPATLDEENKLESRGFDKRHVDPRPLSASIQTAAC